MSTSITRGSPADARSLRPARVSIWPIDGQRYGIDFSYVGPTGYADAERAEQLLKGQGLGTSFRQELDQAWTVRLGPLPRTAMRAVLDQYL